MVPSENDFDTKITLESEVSPLREEPPFRILVLGDWSGRTSRHLDFDWSNSNPLEIDKDNFDEVFRKLAISLNLEFSFSGANNLSLNFTEFDDFHPDKIFRQLPIFADLRNIRRRLTNSQTFNEAAREVRSWLIEAEASETLESGVNSTSTEQTEPVPGNLLDQILGQQSAGQTTGSQTQNTGFSELSTFIKKLVKPHLIQTDTAEQSKLLIIVDEVISDLMRKIFQHPQFQALESAWRGLYLLVRRLETDSTLQIYLTDISKEEVSSNFKSVNDLEDSFFYRILSRNSFQQNSDESWAVVCGIYSFSINVDDVAMLMRLSKISSAFKTPFVSHLNPDIFGVKSFGDIENLKDPKNLEESDTFKLWSVLRANPESNYLALAMPRILARLPYGEKTEPTEDFHFEELTNNIEHNHYLWTNPAFAIAILLGQTFKRFSWKITPNFLTDIDNLPAPFNYSEQETKPKSVAEVFLSYSDYEKILQRGLIPVLSFKGKDHIRLGSIQSVRYPSALLKGRWS